MGEPRRVGRPRAASRAMLEEAACELFLEQGYEATSVADITRRAGVSRSSFFNYFSSKSDVLWSGLDERIDHAVTALTAHSAGADGETLRAILLDMLRGFAPDPLALALRNVAVMGLENELVRDTGLRHARLSAAIADAAVRGGIDTISADILGAAYAAAGRGAPGSGPRRGLRPSQRLPSAVSTPRRRSRRLQGATASFGTPSDRLTEPFRNRRPKGKLSAADADGTVREIRRALLDADV